MIEFKEGVRLHLLQPQMLIALQVVGELYDNYRLPLVVTSCNDSTHGEQSLHYKGLAMDFRTKNAPGIAKGIYLAARAKLRHLGFDVLFEGEGGENEHIHVEWDPKD